MESLLGKELKNRYRIDASLGRGGMAEVYKAYDLKRASYVAIKLLREDLSRDKVFIRRFEREAKTLAQLQHRNIVRFYGLERDNLDVFIVMDFIEGKTLRDVIFENKEPLSIERMLEILEPVCSALHYAHEMGIVHCDIKPANIILAKNGEVMVSDFGIARSMDTATSTMVGIGTPAYMAPELIRGEDPTPQTDIYALGIVMYEMLTGGERPFTGERAEITGTTAEKVRWEHLELEPEPISHFNPTVSKEVEDVVMKCLEKKAQSRYQSIDDFWNEFSTQTISLRNEKDLNTLVQEEVHKPDEFRQNKNEDFLSVSTKQTIDSKKKNKPTLKIIFSVVLITLGVIAGIKQGWFKGEQKQTIIQPTPEIEFSLENITKENIQNLDIYKTMGYGEINNVVYSPQGGMVIVSTMGGVYVLDPITLEIDHSYQSQESDGVIIDIDISSQGTKLAVAYSDGKVVVIEPEDFTLISELVIPNTEIINIKLSHDGNLIACSTSDFRVDLWDIERNSKLQEFSGFGDVVSDIAFSMDDQLLATSSYDGNVIVWNLVSYQQVKTFYDLQYGAVAVEFSPDNTSLAMAENIGKIFIYDTNDWSLKNEIETEHQGTLFDLNFSHDGKKLVSCSLDGSIRIWDSEDGGLMNLIDKHENYVTSVDFSFDDSTIVSGSLDGTVRTWDAQSGEQKREKSGFLDFFNFIYPIQNTDTFFSSFGNGDLGVWGTYTFTRELILAYPRYFLSALGFSEDGKEVAFENGDNILLASMEDDYISHSFEGFESAVYALAISPDKKMLAAGGYDQIVKIYDIETEAELYEFSFWDESVEYLEFSPDGNQLLVIYNDLLIDVNLETYESDDSMYLMEFDYPIMSVQKNDRDGSLYFSFEGGKIGRYKFDTHSLDYLDISLESAITNMSFSNDGSILATVREEGVVQFWDLNTEALVGDLALRKGDFFTIDDIAFSGDGKYFFILGSDSILRVYAVSQNQENTISQQISSTTMPSGVTIEREYYDFEEKISESINQGERLRLFSKNFEYPNDRTVSIIDLYVQCISCDEKPYFQVSKGDGNYDNGMAWSPDGKSIAVLEGDGCGDQNLVVFNLFENEKITYKGLNFNCREIDWSPDGKEIAFNSSDGSLKTLNLESGEIQTIVNSVDIQNNSHDINNISWSPDQSKLAFWTRMAEEANDENGWQIWVVNNDGSDLENLGEKNYGQISVFWSVESDDLIYERFEILGEDERGEYQILSMDVNGGNKRIFLEGEQVRVRSSLFFPNYTTCSSYGCTSGFWDEY